MYEPPTKEPNETHDDEDNSNSNTYDGTCAETALVGAPTGAVIAIASAIFLHIADDRSLTTRWGSTSQTVGYAGYSIVITAASYAVNFRPIESGEAGLALVWTS